VVGVERLAVSVTTNVWPGASVTAPKSVLLLVASVVVPQAA
jgi:hypothetical protein